MNVSRARWVFLRAYLLIVLLVTVVGLGLEWLLEQRHVEKIGDRETALISGTFNYIETLNIPQEAQRLPEIEQLLADSLNLPVRFHPADDFRQLGNQYTQLKAGQVLRLYDAGDEAVFYRLLDQGRWVVALGPAPSIVGDRNPWVVPVFYVLIALAVFLWLRPLMRDLDVLQHAALAFGEQDFSTRVSIPASSWLAPLGGAFNSMAVRIQWLIQSHRELTHAVSHELRTPLARLRFSLEMLGQSDGESRRRHCNSMNQDVEELNMLIDEMLSYAELDQEHLQPRLEPLDVTSWLYDFVEHYNQISDGLRVVLSFQGESRIVLADARLIKRALDNLLGNAQRYAHNSIEIKLSFSMTHCTVRVLDDGPGIPLDKRSAALSAFTRLEPLHGAVSHGFGLGLAIVKRIMDLHNGEVLLNTNANGGADIGLHWPL